MYDERPTQSKVRSSMQNASLNYNVIVIIVKYIKTSYKMEVFLYRLVFTFEKIVL